MNPLKKLIIDKISDEGPITFEKFMDMALYHPELGYYSKPDIVIGRQGDFYTSPHLHPVFGAMIANQLIEMWEVMGRPPEFYTVETGSGAGYLSRDIFDYLNRRPHDLLNSLKHLIVEPFSHFEKRQRVLLDEFTERITWFKSLIEIPAGISGCIFTNELIDAFPVHIVEMDNNLKEIYLDYYHGSFIELKQDVSTFDLTNYIERFTPGLPQGYRTEINIRTREWLKETASILSNGFLMTIDYGYSSKEYYSEERDRGTLLCYHKHQVNEDPYTNIGNQDMTAHVNFSSLKNWGDEFGLKTSGYTSQGAYLVASGIDKIITEMYAGSPDYEKEIKKIKGLIMPEGMGESHMVMIQYKGEGEPELRGFTLRNSVGKL